MEGFNNHPKCDCTSCRYFKSFYEEFDYNPQQSQKQGFCINDESPLYGNKGAGENKICMRYKLKYG